MDEIKILLLGSSIIHQWTSVLSNTPIPLHITNLGKNILTTRDMLLELYLETKIESVSEPSLIIIYCGSNDIPQQHQETNIEQTIENITQILEKIQDLFPNSLVVYLSILKCPGRSKNSAQIEKVNQSIRDFSKKARSEKKEPSRIQFIDLNRELYANPFFFLQDGIHLNEMGYEKLNKIISKQIF